MSEKIQQMSEVNDKKMNSLGEGVKPHYKKYNELLKTLILRKIEDSYLSDIGELNNRLNEQIQKMLVGGLDFSEKLDMAVLITNTQNSLKNIITKMDRSRANIRGKSSSKRRDIIPRKLTRNDQGELILEKAKVIRSNISEVFDKQIQAGNYTFGRLDDTEQTGGKLSYLVDKYKGIREYFSSAKTVVGNTEESIDYTTLVSNAIELQKKSLIYLVAKLEDSVTDGNLTISIQSGPLVINRTFSNELEKIKFINQTFDSIQVGLNSMEESKIVSGLEWISDLPEKFKGLIVNGVKIEELLESTIKKTDWNDISKVWEKIKEVGDKLKDIDGLPMDNKTLEAIMQYQLSRNLLENLGYDTDTIINDKLYLSTQEGAEIFLSITLFSAWIKSYKVKGVGLILRPFKRVWYAAKQDGKKEAIKEILEGHKRSVLKTIDNRIKELKKQGRKINEIKELQLIRKQVVKVKKIDKLHELEKKVDLIEYRFVFYQESNKGKKALFEKLETNGWKIPENIQDVEIIKLKAINTLIEQKLVELDLNNGNTTEVDRINKEIDKLKGMGETYIRKIPKPKFRPKM